MTQPKSVIKALVEMKCKKCSSIEVIKNGKSRNGEQRYRCKGCKTSFQFFFKYRANEIENKQIVLLTKEGCGIRSTSRILNIHPSTVLRRILKIAKQIQRPTPILMGKSYQVDELFTFIGNKENRICIAYSFEPKTREVIDVVIGRRNKRNLSKVVSTLLLANAKRITTDKLNLYKVLIPKEIHSTKFRGINHIERNNLNLRTHLKRLNRRSLCFSKSVVVLLAVVKIYFWGASAGSATVLRQA